MAVSGVEYVDHLPDDVVVNTADFFEGWNSAPDSGRFRDILNAAWAVEIAVRDNQMVGFINAISDGIVTAFIPWLEVITELRGHGIGTALVQRMQRRLAHLYSIDLVCDPDVLPFYTHQGWLTLHAAGLRNPQALETNTAQKSESQRSASPVRGKRGRRMSISRQEPNWEHG